MNATILFVIPFMIAVVAVCYSLILVQPGNILAPYYKWLYERRMFNHDSRACNGLEEHWLFKIIVHCEKCVAGQWTLWIYLFILYKEYTKSDWYIAAAIHIYCVAIAIIYATILKQIIKPQ